MNVDRRRISRRCRLVAAALLVASLGGCSSAPYAEPGTVEGAMNRGFPAIGMSLQEVLAGIHDRGDLDFTTQLVKTTIFRTDTTPWAEATLDEAWAFAPEQMGSIAVIARRQCFARVELETYQMQQVSWFLLSNGELKAFEHYEFGVACAVSNPFEPAPVALAPIEDQVLGWIAQRHAGEDRFRRQYYQRGRAYLRVGRIGAAERMLAEGDAAFDASARGEAARFDRATPEGLITEADRELRSERARLVASIAEARENAERQGADVAAAGRSGGAPAAAPPPVSLAAVTAGAQLRNQAVFSAWFKLLSAPAVGPDGLIGAGSVRARNRRTGRVLETDAATILAGRTGWDPASERAAGRFVEREWQSSTTYGGPAEVPAWLPIYPSLRAPAENLKRTDGEAVTHEGSILAETDDAPDAVLAFYEGALRASGFGRSTDQTGKAGHLTAIHEDGRKLRVHAAPDERRTVLLLEWSDVPH